MLQIIQDEPLFETGLLMAGKVDPHAIQHQLSRWIQTGKIHQLRRGLYSLAAPYQKTVPHPFLTANRLQPNSYISLQSALHWYGMIMEYTPATTCVTTGRPAQFSTTLGVFMFQHIQLKYFFGYHPVQLGSGQSAFVALPEKALLDLIYLQPQGDDPNYLRELRLQNLPQLNPTLMSEMVSRMQKPKLMRAVNFLFRLIEEEKDEYTSL